jgi:hypothetical protein
VELVSFWLMIFLFIIIGFMLLNNYYWQNVRDEQKYKRERFANKDD